jgi:putative FmdB family regulatory protein
MPFYEYRCKSCGHELEALQKISDSPLLDCPECGEPALKKLISAAGFRLKGGGWYETDFKGGKKKNLHDNGEKKGSGTAKDTEKEKPKEKSTEEKKAAAKPKETTSG